MKKAILAVLILALLAGGAFAQKKLEPLMAPGDFAVNASVGYGFFWGAIDVVGGAELVLGQFTIADFLPLTYGAAARASYYSYGSASYRWSYFGAGALGTLHLGLRDLDLPDGLEFLENVDSYIGLGLGYYGYSDNDAYADYGSSRIGLVSMGGVSYFLTPNFALNFEGGYYGYGGGGLIGILFKL